MQEKKTRIIKGALAGIFIVIAALSFGIPQLGAAVTPSKVIPKILVMDDVDKKYTEHAGDYGKAPFDHEQHEKYSTYEPQDKCNVCHHTNKETLVRGADGSASEEVDRCAKCHKAEDSVCEEDFITVGTANAGKSTKGLNAIKSEESVHGKDSLIGCIGCHKERDKKPTSCKECHTGEDTVAYQYKK